MSGAGVCRNFMTKIGRHATRTSPLLAISCGRNYAAPQWHVGAGQPPMLMGGWERTAHSRITRHIALITQLVGGHAKGHAPHPGGSSHFYLYRLCRAHPLPVYLSWCILTFTSPNVGMACRELPAGLRQNQVGRHAGAPEALCGHVTGRSIGHVCVLRDWNTQGPRGQPSTPCHSPPTVPPLVQFGEVP